MYSKFDEVSAKLSLLSIQQPSTMFKKVFGNGKFGNVIQV